MNKDRYIAIAIFAITGVVFWACPVFFLSDSAGTLLLSEHFLRHGNIQLDQYSGLPRGGQITWEGLSKHGHKYYAFPPGSSVLSLPAVAIAKFCGWSCIGADDVWLPEQEARLQRILAAAVCALSTVCFYLLARCFLPAAASITIALAGAFGTQLLSTASTSLWSQTWYVLLLSIALLLLIRGRVVLLALALSWMFFVRPTGAIPIAGISVYVCLYHRRHFAAYAAIGVGWLTLFVVYSQYHFDSLMPVYYYQLLPSHDPDEPAVRFVAERVAGNLFSPSRGLFICVPISLFAVYIAFRSFRRSGHRRLIVLLAACIGLHLFMLGWYEDWYGGFCFGARCTCDLLPCLLLLAVLGLSARPRLAFAEKLAAVVLLSVSVFINGIGACSWEAQWWNNRPCEIRDDLDRLWDWTDPQWLRPFVSFRAGDGACSAASSISLLPRTETVA